MRNTRRPLLGFFSGLLKGHTAVIFYRIGQSILASFFGVLFRFPQIVMGRTHAQHLRPATGAA